jgi:GAF domain-containing protein
MDDELKFEIMRTDSLNVALGGTTGKDIPFKPLRLHDEAGQPNHHNVATHVALTGETINITDAYYAAGFDFSGTRAFDAANGYRSKSFLTIPLRNHAQKVVGILQLINAKDPDSGQVIAFDDGLQQMVETFSLLATTALEAYLREQELKNEIQHLQIVIDEVKRAAQVAEITETDYFQQLRERAQALRKARE